MGRETGDFHLLGAIYVTKEDTIDAVDKSSASMFLNTRQFIGIHYSD